MIFLGGSVTNFQNGFANISVPSVLATLVSNELDFPNLSMVGVDDRAAAKAAVSHLIAQGHRKIAVLGGPATSFPSRMRRLGAQDAMEDAGLVFDDKLYGLCNYDFESAYHAMNSLLARRAEFTALFAMSDVIAFGAIRALVSAGMRVPEDVSVIGFDGITMSRYCVPVMTPSSSPVNRSHCRASSCWCGRSNTEPRPRPSRSSRNCSRAKAFAPAAGTIQSNFRPHAVDGGRY